MSALKLPAPFFGEQPNRLIDGETEEVLFYPIGFDERRDGLVKIQVIYSDGEIRKKGMWYDSFPEYAKNYIEKMPEPFIIDVEGRARLFTPLARRQTGELYGYYSINGQKKFGDAPLEISQQQQQQQQQIEDEGDEDGVMIDEPMALKRKRDRKKVNIPGDMYKSYLAASKRYATTGEIAMRTKVLKKHLTDPKIKDELWEKLHKISPSGYTDVETLQYKNWDEYTFGSREAEVWCTIVNKFYAKLSMDHLPENTLFLNQFLWVLGVARLEDIHVITMDRIILMVPVNVDVLEKVDEMQKAYLFDDVSRSADHRIVCIIDYYHGKPQRIQWIDSSVFITNEQQLLMAIAGAYIFDKGGRNKRMSFLPQNLKTLGLTSWVNYLQMCMRRKTTPIPEKKYTEPFTYLAIRDPIHYQRGRYYGYGMCTIFAAWFSFYILFNYRATYPSLPLLPLHNPREFLVFMWNTILAGELTWDTIPPMIKRVVFADKIKEYGSALLLGDDGEYSEVDDPDSDVYKKFGEGMKKRKRGRFEKGSRAAKKIYGLFTLLTKNLIV